MSLFSGSQNILINNLQEDSPQDNIRLALITCRPRYSAFTVSSSNEQPWVISGSRTPLEECSMFEQPYFSSRYIQMPTNYNTFLPRWVNARITKDNLSVWANAGIYHDRAFGEWHNVFGPRYLYGENRRL
ncbi:uncharacterized protein LOC106055436 isoform X1 [Biomphalaria glabrata]|uniref:Uncharacterized protein LOC106055436 isoform X1 n=1 Tax=Biomphalaria glabrata TaxID=6526 RepID=A0A9U8E015_BIOGL|nr:uncharacterized protein LOC106055436 isoform X1 [Biomphalaria glabrata]